MTNGLRGRTNGLTNGLTNGTGRTNGLTNGIGRTNGLTSGMGRTNGLTNGLGRTNGLSDGRGRPNRPRNIVGFTNGLSLRANKFGIVTSSDIRRTGAFIALSLVAMLVLAFFLGVQAPPSSPFKVDGNFSEWANVPAYTYHADASGAGGDLVAYALHEEQGQLFIYGRTVGPIFAASQASVIYVEIDDPARAGYAVPGFDADYLAELWGSNNSLEGATLRAWTGAPDRDNASAFQDIGGFPAAVVGNEFEMALDDYAIHLAQTPGIRLRLVSEFPNLQDNGATVGLGQGALVITQTSLTADISSTTALLEVHLRAQLTDLLVTNLAVGQTGGGTVSLPSLPITIFAGQERIVQVGVDVSGLPVGTFVSFNVTGATARTTSTNVDVPVTVTGTGVRTYAKARPVGHIVDGLFDDWPTTTPDPIDSVPASIDLRATAFAIDTDPYFYVQTRGDIMTGTVLPERRVPLGPPGNNSPPVVLPRRAGEDTLQIYIDSGAQPGVGPSVGGINADRLIEVRGRAGRVTRTAAYTWNSTTWNWDPRSDPFKIAFVATQLEASIAASFFTATNQSRVVYAMSDWSGDQDWTNFPIVKSAPSLMGSAPSPLHAAIPDNITATPLLNTPTVDGKCDSFPGEYTGATIGSNSAIAFAIGVRNDTGDVYVCIRETADTTGNNNDWGEIIFDTLHNGGTAPQVDDKLFWLFGNGDNVLKAWQGTGTGWATTCPGCDPTNIGRSRFSTNEWFEFRIKYNDVWNTSTPLPTQVAGFAIITFDFKLNVLHTWGGDAVNENVPDSWGHVFFLFEIPEFPSSVLVAIVTVVCIPAVRRGLGGRRAVRGRRTPPATQNVKGRGPGLDSGTRNPVGLPSSCPDSVDLAGIDNNNR